MDHGGRIEVILGCMYSGKCLAHDTSILMHDGTAKMVQDIIPGDVAMGDDSTGRNILGTCRGESELFKVTPSFGDAFVVNEDHVLSLKCSYTPKKYRGKLSSTRYQKGKVENISVKDYLSESNVFKSYYKGYRTGVDFEEKPVLLNPYILGVWLGDGDADGPRITNSDREIISEIYDYARSIGLKVNVYPNPTQTSSAYHVSTGKPNGDNPFLHALDQLRVRRNKHVPHMYKANSREVRMQILAGLLDTDGYYSEARWSYEITQKLKVLADDIAYLARSLGMVAYVTKVQKSWTYKGVKKWGPYHRVHISGSNLHEIPCRVERRKAVKHTNRNDLLVGITVESIGWGKYYGFETDGNHLFLLGDFTVTHNSSELLRRIRRMTIANRACLVIKYRADVRYSEKDVATHDKQFYAALPCSLLSEARDKAPRYDCIGIDEGQFFPDIVEFCEDMANLGKTVIVAALDGNFDRKPFGRILELIPKAEDVIKLNAICIQCGKNASFSSKISGNTEVEVDIGGIEKYIATCRSCHHRK